MILITVACVYVPPAIGLYGMIGASVVAMGWSASVCQLAIYGVQCSIMLAGCGVFMGVNEVVSMAYPEFEEFSEEYWYVCTMLYIVSSVSMALLCGVIVDSVFVVSNGVRSFVGLSSLRMGAEDAVRISGSAAVSAGSRVSRVFGVFARVLGLLVLYGQLDDFLTGVFLILGDMGSLNKSEG
jgi:hypothetical protein